MPGNVCGGKIIGDPFLQMDGQAVFKFAVKVLDEVADEALRRTAGIEARDIDWLIPHQANVRIIAGDREEARHCPRKSGRHRGPPRQHLGGLGAAGARRGGARRADQARPQVLLEGVGGGFTWGAALLKYLNRGMTDTMKFGIGFPGPGLAVGRHAGRLRRSPGSPRHLREASEALGHDLWQLVTDGPAEELNLTVNTQPRDADRRVSPSSARGSGWAGREPAMVAGHSLGEYTALVAAGALAFRGCAAAGAAARPGDAGAVPPGKGAMAAILGLDDDAVRAACAEAAQGEVVEAVNFNSPGQVVIAGHKAAVRAGDGRLQGARRQARPAAAGERAVPFLADAAGRREAAGTYWPT